MRLRARRYNVPAIPIDQIGGTTALVRNNNRAARIHGFIDRQPPRFAVRRQYEDIREVIDCGHCGLIAEAFEFDCRVSRRRC